MLAEALSQADPEGRKSFNAKCLPSNDPRPVGEEAFKQALIEAINKVYNILLRFLVFMTN